MIRSVVGRMEKNMRFTDMEKEHPVKTKVLHRHFYYNSYLFTNQVVFKKFPFLVE